ncbi:MAG: acryloyl-CoA reductase [Myxococcales bacterium]|nr:acryloyl-CoA reductase [Myxococcales bacterium]
MSSQVDEAASRAQVTAVRISASERGYHADVVPMNGGALTRVSDPAGEVLVRVHHSSLNYKDALALTGAGKVVRRFPCVAGIDLAGEVVASSSEAYRPGQLVLATGYDLGTAHDGGLATHARLPARWLVPLPAALSSFEAMCLGTAGFTAALAIERMEAMDCEPSRGPVVVSGATGGVGSLAIDMLAGRGYEVAALTGKLGNEPMLSALGARQLLDRHTVTSSKALDTGRWAGGIDNLGGPYLAWMLATALPGAVVASVGNAAHASLTTTVFPFILRGVSLLGIDSAYCPAARRERVWSRLALDLRPRSLGQFVKTLALSQVIEASRMLLAGTNTGRFVVDLTREA